MSDLMLLGVLREPYDLAMGDELSRRQYHGRGQQAADEIDRLTAERDELLRDNRRKIGALARYRIETQLVDQLLEEGPNTETTSLDMEYWCDQHDKLKAALVERDALREQLTLAESVRASQVAGLTEGMEALQRDALRYRYLRDIKRQECLLLEGPEAGVWCDCENEFGELILLTEGDLDAAIDAAMKGEA